MSATESPTENCKLCGQYRTIRWSHIVPRWTFRRVIQMNNGSPNPVFVDETTAKIGGQQYAEFMLCETCEQRLGLLDNYIAGITLKPDGSFAARQQVTLIPGQTVADWEIADASMFDTEKITRFAASVIWRASASRFFGKVSLGPRYSPIFANYLLDDVAPFPDCARLLVQVIKDDGSMWHVDRYCVAPVSGRQGAYHMHHFSLFGMWFQLAVGGVLPRPLSSLCISATSKVILSNGTRLLRAVGEHVATVTPKGKLANRKLVSAAQRKALLSTSRSASAWLDRIALESLAPRAVRQARGVQCPPRTRTLSEDFIIPRPALRISS